MKLELILVDLLVLASVLGPYLIFIAFGSSRTRKMKLEFLKQVEQHGISPEVVDHWNQNYMALDRDRAHLLFVQMRPNDSLVELVELKKVRSKNLNIISSTVRMNDESREVLQRIDLEIYLKGGETIVLPLFNSDYAWREDYELQHAEKWNAIIAEYLPIEPLLRSVA